MSNSQGWISLHRKLLDNPIFSNYKLLQTFLYCLLKASHSDREQLVGDELVNIKTGQLVTGRKAISKATKLSEQNVRTALNRLEKLGILTIKPTTKYSLITVVTWESHQQTNQQVTNKQPTTNQRVTTNNNCNNVNNDNKREKIPYQLIADAYEKNYSEPTGNAGLVPTKQWSSKRKSAIKKLWNLDTDNELEKNHTNNIEHWERYFDYCSSIGFFQGDAARSGDHSNWKASFDFLIKIDTYNSNKERKYS